MRTFALLLALGWFVSLTLFVPFPTTVNVIVAERKQIAPSLLLQQTENPVRSSFAVKEVVAPQAFLESDEGRRYTLAKL